MYIYESNRALRRSCPFMHHWRNLRRKATHPVDAHIGVLVCILCYCAFCCGHGKLHRGATVSCQTSLFYEHLGIICERLGASRCSARAGEGAQCHPHSSGEQ